MESINLGNPWFYGLKFEILYKDEVVDKVRVEDGVVYVEKLNTELGKGFFLFEEDIIGLTDLVGVFESRCWDKNRSGLKRLLKGIGLEEYNEYEIVRRTHGTTYDDYWWFRFEGEEHLKYDDVRSR